LQIQFTQGHVPYSPGYMPSFKNDEQRQEFFKMKKIGYTGDFTYEVYGLTKNMPENMKDFAATYAHTVGNQCLSLYNSLQV
jgi:hypothetical protein